MTLTLNSASAAFCTAAQFVTFFDWRPFAQYCVDNDTPPTTSASFQTNANLAIKLQVASGLIEMAASRGARYDPILDLAALAASSTNGGVALQQMTASLAAYEIAGRRMEALPVYVRDMIERAQSMLVALENGEIIFPFTEAQQAGILTDYKEVANDVELRNMPSFIAQNLMGRRANRRIATTGTTTNPCCCDG